MTASDCAYQFLKKLKLHKELVPETLNQLKPSEFLWCTGKAAKKIGSIGRQNKNNIIWFLGSLFKYYFAQHTQKENAKCIIYYNNDKASWF